MVFTCTAASRYAPALVYRYKGVKVISLAVVVFFLVYFSLSMYWASQLRTPEGRRLRVSAPALPCTRAHAAPPGRRCLSRRGVVRVQAHVQRAPRLPG